MLFNLCKENPTLVNGVEVRGKAELTDGDQFVIGYRAFVFRDAAYAARRSVPRPFGAATATATATGTETETADGADDVKPTRHIVEGSDAVCHNPKCRELAKENAGLLKSITELRLQLKQGAWKLVDRSR